MNPHPHAAIIRAYADDPTVKIEQKIGSGNWFHTNIQEVLCYTDNQFRLAPKEPQVDPEGWIEWQGGECPVSGDTLIDYEGFASHKNIPAKMMNWVAKCRYRIHKPAEKAKRYKYLWAHKAGTVVFREEEFDGASVGAIRLEWSKTEVPE
jgi:hypothetical protein